MTLIHWNFSYFCIPLHRPLLTAMPTGNEALVGGNELGMVHLLFRSVGRERLHFGIWGGYLG